MSYTRLTVSAILVLSFGPVKAQTSSPPANNPASDIRQAAGLDRPRSPGDKAWFRTIRSNKYHPSRLLVRYKSGVGPQTREAARARAGAMRTTRSFTLVDNLHVIEVPAGTVPQVLQKLLDEDDVLYAEPDYELQFLITPNDPRFADQWGLRNIGQTVNGDPGISGADVRATSVWDHWTGDPNFVIASIDTGVQLTHPDLAANIWLNPGEIPGNGVDDDGNGYVDDRTGWDFIDNDNDPTALSDAHGTLTSGVFAAVGDNGAGIAGVNWHCKLAVFRGGNVSHVPLSLQYCINKNIRVSNNSYGGVFTQSEYDAISSAAHYGHIFVTSAGNDASDGDVTPHFPAAYKLPNIINVLATDNNDLPASFATYGLTTADLGAPGQNVLSTTLAGGYDYAGGSSMATPFVTGACGLLLSRYPTLDYRQVVGRIIRTARPVPALAGKCVSDGVLDINKALRGDCDNDGTPDLQEIVNGTQGDCNKNGLPDDCEGLPDCNANGIPDSCEMGGVIGIYQNHNPDVSLSTYTRIDPEINFDWGTGSPIPGSIGTDNFRVRWEGTVVPKFSETYTFFTLTDDGVRLYINGQLLIDHYNPQSPTEWSGSLALTAGVPCQVVMEYFEQAVDAQARLRWSSPSLPKQILSFSPNDCNRNGALDACEPSFSDCNNNGAMDSCELVSGGASVDCDSNSVLDTCELTTRDCNNNGIMDGCDLASGGAAVDCDGNAALDTCELPTHDCNNNGLLDACEIRLPDTQSFVMFPPESADSLLTYNGAAFSQPLGFQNYIWLNRDGTGSANFTQSTAAPTSGFEASFEIQKTNESQPVDSAVCFALYDASSNGPTLLYGGDGPAGNSLTFSIVFHSATNHHCELRRNGAVLASVVPTVPLPTDPCCWTRTRVHARFLEGRITVDLSDLQSGSFQIVFNGVSVPGFTPYRAHFGFGASRTDSNITLVRAISILAVTPTAPASLDRNSNLIPDECEVDCNGNGIPDDGDLVQSAAFSVNFDGPGGSAYVLNGSASVVSGAVQLTPATQSMTGTVIFDRVTPAPVEAFTASFDFMMGGGNGGADGLSFALLNSATQDSKAIFGESGPPLDYLTLKFDTYQNTGEPNADFLSLRYQGIHVADYSAPFDLNNSQWHHVTVSLQAGAVTVVLTPAGGSPVTAFNAVPLPGFTPRSARFGFGASTGALTDAHWVDNVSISASLAHSQDANANDIPDECETDCDNNGVSDVYQRQASAGHVIEFNATGDTPWTGNGSASVVSDQMRLTSAAGNQTGTLVLPPTPGYVNAFEASFRFRIGGGSGVNGADGLSFTMMDAGVFPSTALFGEQGPGPQALTLKFDTFQNSGEVNGNHLALLYNGATLATYTPAFTLNDNVERSVSVKFSNGLITVVLNDTVTAFNNVSVPGYVAMPARFGFGARTGGFNNEHWVDGIFINAHMPVLSDCDSNGLPNGCETDCNSNGVPDECGSIGSGAYTATFQGAGDTPYRLNASAGIALNQHLELTPQQPSRVGTMVFEPVTPGPVEAFTAHFDFYMGAGDGFSFVLLDAAHWGSDCLFGESGPAHHALAIEFDTFNNGGVDPNGNHVTIWYNGAAVATANAGFLLASGAWNHAMVTLAGGAVTITWTAGIPNNTATILNAVPIPGFTPVAGRFGLGARNGGLFSAHWLDNVVIATDLVQLETNSDGDSVPNACDACPGTIPNSPVDDAGCPPLIPADFDRDGDVDSDDLNHLRACGLGPAMPQTNSACANALLDGDDDVDHDDFGIFQRCYRGKDAPADPDCAD